MVIAIMSVVYLLWPLKLMKKSEYATFFLCSFSIYWLLMLLLHIYLGGFHHKTSLTQRRFSTTVSSWESRAPTTTAPCSALSVPHSAIATTPRKCTST